jgi:hypothetical protein
MASTTFNVTFSTNDTGNRPGKLADAELHFTDGPLDGLKLIGFSIWEPPRRFRPERHVPGAPVHRERRAPQLRVASADHRCGGPGAHPRPGVGGVWRVRGASTRLIRSSPGRPSRASRFPWLRHGRSSTKSPRMWDGHPAHGWRMVPTPRHPRVREPFCFCGVVDPTVWNDDTARCQVNCTACRSSHLQTVICEVFISWNAFSRQNLAAFLHAIRDKNLVDTHEPHR